MTTITPRRYFFNHDSRGLVPCADIWKDSAYTGGCLGVLVLCSKGVKKILEGEMYPDDAREIKSNLWRHILAKTIPYRKRLTDE